MTSAYHHVGVRVSNIAEAIQFYRDALGARVLVDPYEHTGEVADSITGHRGSTMRMAQLAFDGDAGGFVELFEFAPAELAPDSPVPYTHQQVLHFGLQVDDVEATLASVEAAGGSRVFDPRQMASGDTNAVINFCYCRDPDGNVIELADGPMVQIVRIIQAREQA
jgi:catechol 2,3-dioxygenase-like lactoylglutathione lyase family enzyme